MLVVIAPPLQPRCPETPPEWISSHQKKIRIAISVAKKSHAPQLDSRRLALLFRTGRPARHSLALRFLPAASPRGPTATGLAAAVPRAAADAPLTCARNSHTSAKLWK